ncbi:MAG TPA: hypothetical protein VKA15_03755 [Isosphaeraceae bacterium]|nr:hypothetical protein [Isosphaeraceae bacterium]
MTTTDTSNLAEILNAKKADLVAPIVEVHVYAPTLPHDVVTGEIVPVEAVEDPPILPPAPPAPPVEVVDYTIETPKVLGAIPFAEGYWRMANRVCKTEFVPSGFRGNREAIVAAFMRGYEMGFPPMQALDSFNVIEGRVGLTAEAMRALITSDGHDIIMEDVISGQTGKVEAVVANCHRKEWPEDRWHTYGFTMEDARTAGLLAPSRSGKPTAWQKYPRDMLQARATSGAGRRYFADVLAGMSYTPEEIRDFSGPEQEVTPSPTTTVPPEPPASAPVLSASAPSETPPAPSTERPKRPRGRPRKAQSAPIAAPGPSVPESSITAPESELTIVPSTPPELTSLNSPGEIGVTREMLKVLTQQIKSLPTAQQVPCRGFIRQHFPEGSDDLSPADVQKCIDIAAGWPDSEAQHPVPEANEPLPF